MADYNLKYTGEQVDDLLDKINDLGEATQSEAGIMSAGDKTKLDGVEAGAEGNVVEGVSIDGVEQTITDKKVIIGLDAIPTANSKKLMTSGSIKTAIDPLASKATGAVEGNIAVFDGNGNPVDGGVSIDSIGGKPGIALGIADVESAGTAQVFTKRQSGGGGVAVMKRIKGNSIVWNQLVRDTSISGSATQAGAQAYIIGQLNTGSHIFKNHVAYIRSGKVTVQNANGKTLNIQIDNQVVASVIVDSDDFTYKVSALATITHDEWHEIRLYIGSLTAGQGVVISWENVNAFDLTEMFGSGNEPSSADAFVALYSGIYANNDGSIRNNTAEKLISAGFNKLDIAGRTLGTTTVSWQSEVRNWDETKFYLGLSVNNYCQPSKVTSYSISAGEVKVTGDSTSYGIAFPIKCLPNTTYYLHADNISASGNGPFSYMFFDGGGNFISGGAKNNNTELTTPGNCTWLVIILHSITANVENVYSNICINISDASRNGTYEPYQTPVEVNLGITTMTGKLNGEGSSVTIFGADGAKSVGSTCDTINEDGKSADKRIGTRAYQSGDESDSTVVTDGTNTNYVLSTPEHYILDNPIDMMYFVDEDGTEEATQPTGATLPAAPFACDTNYSIRIQKLLQVLNSLS